MSCNLRHDTLLHHKNHMKIRLHHFVRQEFCYCCYFSVLFSCLKSCGGGIISSSYFESLDYGSQKHYVDKLKMREIGIPDAVQHCRRFVGEQSSQMAKCKIRQHLHILTQKGSGVDPDF